MKKLLLLALATLSVSVAQAVTITWNGSSVDISSDSLSSGSTITDESSSRSVSMGTLTSTTSWTAICLLTVSNLELSSYDDNGQRYPSLFGVAQGNGDSALRLAANYSSGAISVESPSGFTASTTGSGTLANGTYEIILSYNGNNTLSIYLNGTIFATVTASEASTWANYGTLVVGASGAGNQLLSTGADYSATVYYTTGSTIDDLVTAATTPDTPSTNTPEPTVLALLALGVAGLALKRKVA